MGSTCLNVPQLTEFLKLTLRVLIIFKTIKQEFPPFQLVSKGASPDSSGSILVQFKKSCVCLSFYFKGCAIQVKKEKVSLFTLGIKPLLTSGATVGICACSLLFQIGSSVCVLKKLRINSMKQSISTGYHCNQTEMKVYSSS